MAFSVFTWLWNHHHSFFSKYYLSFSMFTNPRKPNSEDSLPPLLLHFELPASLTALCYIFQTMEEETHASSHFRFSTEVSTWLIAGTVQISQLSVLREVSSLELEVEEERAQFQTVTVNKASGIKNIDLNSLADSLLHASRITEY